MAFIARFLGRMLRNVRCGEAGLTCNLEYVKAKPESIVVKSSDFKAGEAMPKVHAGNPPGDNVSPAFSWEGVPAGTKELLFFMEDTDIPLWFPAVHTVATGISPSLSSLPKGALEAPAKDTAPESPVTLQKGTFGFYGYHGPQPIPGHGSHHYHFTFIAVDNDLTGNLKTPASYAQVIKAMEGHVLAWGRLIGTYDIL